jgi:hypothetical protein
LRPTPSPSSNPAPKKGGRRRWSDQQKGNNGELSKAELQVLKTTSRINTRTYVPFDRESDMGEQFAYPIPFTDKDGLLPLSEKQRKRLKAWMRPDEFISNNTEPKVIDRIDSGTIKQVLPNIGIRQKWDTDLITCADADHRLLVCGFAGHRRPLRAQIWHEIDHKVGIGTLGFDV